MPVKSPPTEAIRLPWNDKFLARCFMVVLPDMKWKDGKLIRVKTSELIEFTAEVQHQAHFARIEKIPLNVVRMHSGRYDGKEALALMARVYANQGYNLVEQKFSAYQLYRHDDPDDTP